MKYLQIIQIILVYLKIALGEDEYITNGNCYIEKHKNIIFMKNLFSIPEFKKISYITSNQEIREFTKSKKIFFGNGSLNKPDCLFANVFESKSGIGNCVGLEFEIELKEFEEKYLNIIVGQENTEYLGVTQEGFMTLNKVSTSKLFVPTGDTLVLYGGHA